MSKSNSVVRRRKSGVAVTEAPVASAAVEGIPIGPGPARFNMSDVAREGIFGGYTLLNGEQLSQLLRISVSTLNELKEARKIPYLRLGRRAHRYRLPDVLEALEKFKVNSIK